MKLEYILVIRKGKREGLFKDRVYYYIKNEFFLVFFMLNIESKNLSF